MIDGEWKVVYPDTAYSFGAHGFPVFNTTTPELGSVDLKVGDADRPFEDGRNFGTDTRAGRTVSFDLGVTSFTDEAVTRQRVEEFLNVWRADSVRRTPGALAELHTQYRGVERVMYGRPRKADVVFKNTSVHRYASIQATFDCQDDVFYGATPRSAQVGLYGGDGGGLVAPLIAPLATTASSDRSVYLNVDGVLPAWPVITITGGDVINPVLELSDLWTLSLDATLLYDDTVVIDTRPWKRTVTRNGQSIAGTLSRESTRLARAAIPSGEYEFAFRGRSSSNTATATIEVRGAYTSL